MVELTRWTVWNNQAGHVCGVDDKSPKSLTHFESCHCFSGGVTLQLWGLQVMEQKVYRMDF